MNEPDAKAVYSRVSTYVLAVLVLLVAGLCAVSPDVIRLATTPRFHAAAPVTPWIAIGVMFQGVYLVGSVGSDHHEADAAVPGSHRHRGCGQRDRQRILDPEIRRARCRLGERDRLRDTCRRDRRHVLAGLSDHVTSGGGSPSYSPAGRSRFSRPPRLFLRLSVPSSVF